MLSNENLLNAQNAYINQLQTENSELKTKLRKAADDVLTADGLRVAKESELNRTQMIVDGLRKTIRDMQAAAAQRTHDDETISQLRRHNMQLRAEIERLKKTSGYTGVPMQVAFDGKPFQNNEEGLKAFAQAIQDAERKEYKDALDRYYEQFMALNNENRRLENHLRSAERALEEKEAELEARRVHCCERSERNADQAPHKIVLTSCTPEEREEALKQIKFMEDHITGFLDRMMKR